MAEALYNKTNDITTRDLNYSQQAMTSEPREGRYCSSVRTYFSQYGIIMHT